MWSTSITSIHRPNENFLNKPDKYFTIPNTYEKKLTENAKYFADSGGNFRFGNPIDSEEFNSGENVQIGIHPIWWIESEKNVNKTIEEVKEVAKEYSVHILSRALGPDGGSIISSVNKTSSFLYNFNAAWTPLSEKYPGGGLFVRVTDTNTRTQQQKQPQEPPQHNQNRLGSRCVQTTPTSKQSHSAIAFVKAKGTGFTGVYKKTDITYNSPGNSRPTIEVSDEIASDDSMRNITINLSVSDEMSNVVAFVILEHHDGNPI